MRPRGAGAARLGPAERSHGRTATATSSPTSARYVTGPPRQQRPSSPASNRRMTTSMPWARRAPATTGPASCHHGTSTSNGGRAPRITPSRSAQHEGHRSAPCRLLPPELSIGTTMPLRPRSHRSRVRAWRGTARAPRCDDGRAPSVGSSPNARSTSTSVAIPVTIEYAASSSSRGSWRASGPHPSPPRGTPRRDRSAETGGRATGSTREAPGA